MARICTEQYTRPGPPVGDGATIGCTYISGHQTPRHSWETLRVQDELDVATAQAARHGLPSDIEALLRNIRSGNADAYIEVLLATLHNRKRALRNTPGFPV